MGSIRRASLHPTPSTCPQSLFSRSFSWSSPFPRHDSWTSCLNAISGACGPRARGAIMEFLEIQDVVKFFGPLEVLKGTNLSVSEHQVVCLIGPSGCGKSTLLRCINGLETIQGGEIDLAGD